MSALDVGARGLAMFAGRRTDRVQILERLSRGIARGGLPPVMTNPPTIGSPSPTTSIATATTYYPPDSPTLYTPLRATWAQAGGSYPLQGFWRPTAVNSPGGGATNGGSQPLVRFWCDAAQLEIINRVQSGGYRLRVDGQYVSSGLLAHNQPSGAFIHTPIDWAGVRKARLYEFEGLSNTDFGGVRIGATSRIWPAPVADGLRVLVHGDSFVEGGLGYLVGQLLGQADSRGAGLGGTGFINNVGGTKYTFQQRVQTDVIAASPDVVVELGGINDESSSGTTIQAAVTAWLDTVQAALPNALIFMTGPMTPGTPTASRLTVRDAKKAACVGRANCLFIDNLADNWVTGTGKAGATAGNGNADWVTGTDGTHPTDEGHAYLANRLVQAIAARIPRG